MRAAPAPRESGRGRVGTRVAEGMRARARGRRSPAPRCGAATPSHASGAARRLRARGIGQEPPRRSRKTLEPVEVESACVIANCAPDSTLRSNRSSSRSRSSAVGLTATPMKKSSDGRSPCRVVDTLVESGQQLDEADRVDLVHAPRAGVVAHVRRVARHREDVAHAVGMRPQKDTRSVQPSTLDETQ